MIDMLDPREMVSLNRALAKRTSGRVCVGPDAISVRQGIALWNATADFNSEPVTLTALRVRCVRRSKPRNACVRDGATLRRALGTGTVLAATAALGACATLGGNIKGHFSCRAPDGICAPTSTIDDAALALIGGDASATPAGPYTPAPSFAPRTIQTAAAEPVRSGEKVLRIVFPAHIDGAGRFRETTAIHAVVERGAWMAAATAPTIPVRTSAVSVDVRQGYVGSQSAAMLSLGELASAAPEVRFPHPVAAIDAENGGQETADTTPAPSNAVTPMATRPASLSRSAAVAASPVVGVAAPIVAGALTANAMTSVRYSLPPRAAGASGAPNLMDAIREQVSERLRAATPVAAKPKNAPAPSGATGSGAPIGGTASAKPVSGPSLFPASEINP